MNESCEYYKKINFERRREMHPQIVKDKLAIVPENPGCYLMRNQMGTIIYVGKAKNLKNRVRSYFTGAHTRKVQMMVNEIHDFEIIITATEAEALILESQLIKSHQPRYNILLKDDKSYPFIAITDEKNPRIILTREPKKKYRFLAGPYISSYEARNTIEILNYMFPLRKCVKMPKKVCLYYHIHQCLGYCEFDFPPEIYDNYIKDIIEFLRGKQTKIIQELERKMYDASDRMEYEQAGNFKRMIDTIHALASKQGTYPNIKKPTDVISYAFNEEYIAIQIFHVRDGGVVARESDVFVYETGEPLSLIESYVHQFYASRHVVLPAEIYANEDLHFESVKSAFEDITFFTPQRGTKKQLLEFANENAHKALEQKSLLAQNNYNKTIGATIELGNLLQIAPPHTMEMIDTANLGDTNIVSAAVVFTNGAPNKKLYRKYKIKSTEVQDDYQALREVVYRRLYRMQMEDTPYSDLLIVDGGLGHLHVALEVVKTFNAPMTVIGLSKNSKHRTEAIVLPDGQKIPLKTNTDLYKLLGKMQEEVHRFVIGYHRQQRIQSAFSSSLMDIPGIGEARRGALMQKFGTLDAIKNATKEQLMEVVPENQATAIQAYYSVEHEEETE